MTRSWRRMIRGRWWTFRLVGAADLQAHAVGRERLLGITIYPTREILILDTLKGAQLLEIIHHEWEHAEHPEMDHRRIVRRARQIAGIVSALVDGAHRARAR